MTVVSHIVSWKQGRAIVAHKAPAPHARPAPAAAGAPATGSTKVSLSGAATANTAVAAAAVTYTDRIKRSGNVKVDALLAGGSHWFHEPGADGSVPSAVARKTLTYSFITDSAGLSAADARGFQPLDAAQQQRVRDALAYYSNIIDVRFEEVGSGGDLKYGANTQEASAGYARYPGDGSQVMLAANQGSFGGDWASGSYGWQVLLHETGHALGLKHPGNYNAGGGGTPGPYLAAADDNRRNTLMSYNNGPGQRRIVADGASLQRRDVNASTLQGLDIGALQYLYGASTTSTAGTYSWATDEAFAQTIWNPNAGSRIDLSNQTRNSIVDLREGRWSSIAMRDAYAETGRSATEYAQLRSGGRPVSAILGNPTYTGQNNLLIAKGSRVTAADGGSGNETFIANRLDNTISGGAGNDRVFWNGGNLTVDGGDGRDAVFVKRVAGANWSLSDDKSTLSLARADGSSLGTISLAGVEAVRFWDGANLRPVGGALYVAA